MPSSGPISIIFLFNSAFLVLKRLVGGRKIKIAEEVFCKVKEKSADRNDVRVGYQPLLAYMLVPPPIPCKIQ